MKLEACPGQYRSASRGSSLGAMCLLTDSLWDVRAEAALSLLPLWLLVAAASLLNFLMLPLLRRVVILCRLLVVHCFPRKLTINTLACFQKFNWHSNACNSSSCSHTKNPPTISYKWPSIKIFRNRNSITAMHVIKLFHENQMQRILQIQKLL